MNSAVPMRARVLESLAKAGWPRKDIKCFAAGLVEGEVWIDRDLEKQQAHFARLCDSAEQRGLPLAADFWARLWGMANCARRSL